MTASCTEKGSGTGGGGTHCSEATHACAHTESLYLTQDNHAHTYPHKSEQINSVHAHTWIDKVAGSCTVTDTGFICLWMHTWTHTLSVVLAVWVYSGVGRIQFDMTLRAERGLVEERDGAWGMKWWFQSDACCKYLWEMRWPWTDWDK